MVRFAGALVEPRRRGDKVGDIRGFPDLLARVRVVYLGSNLDGRVPDAAMRGLLRRSARAAGLEDSPHSRVDYLAHQRGAILEEEIEGLGLDRKASGACPLCVLGLELTKEL